MKCTFEELELQNGEKIKLTLNFARLLMLKNKRRDAYEEYNKQYFEEKNRDATFSAITIVYTAYLCANIDQLDDDKLMSKQEFMENIPQSFTLINKIATNLTDPKQKKISGAPLPKQQKR